MQVGCRASPGERQPGPCNPEQADYPNVTYPHGFPQEAQAAAGRFQHAAGSRILANRRRPVIAKLTICAAYLLLGDAAGSSKQPEELKLIPIEQAIIDATNAERTRYGLAPLEVDRELVKSARARELDGAAPNAPAHAAGSGREHRHGAAEPPRGGRRLDALVRAPREHPQSGPPPDRRGRLPDGRRHGLLVSTVHAVTRWRGTASPSRHGSTRPRLRYGNSLIWMSLNQISIGAPTWSCRAMIPSVAPFSGFFSV